MQLRALRDASGLSLRQLEKKAGISNPKISMWENGHRLPSLEDLETALDALDVSSDDRERLLSLRREAEGPGVLLAGAPSIGTQLAELIKQEKVAQRITEVAPLLIPGLLQTSDYARAILGGHPDTDVRVTLRLGRREVINRPQDPVEFHALISDEALSRSIAPAPVMAEQLRHLLGMSKRPNVTIRLVPNNQAAYTPMLAGPFILLEFATKRPIVHLEHHRASASLWEPRDVRGFITAVEEINEIAMTPERTSEVIEELLNGLETAT